MRTLYQPMYRLETADHDIASDWFYSQSECVGYNQTMYNSFEITRGLVEHIIIDSVPYPCDVVQDDQLFYLTYEDNEASVHLKE